MNQLAQLENKIKESPTASEAEIEALSKKVGELEAEIDKRASKKMLSKKIAELSKKLSDEDGIIAENETVTTASKTATGKGIVATDEINKDTLGNAEWFRDLLKAHSKLVGLK
jgi:hypothetical protein